METITSSVEKTSDILQNLSLETKNKTPLEAASSTKKVPYDSKDIGDSSSIPLSSGDQSLPSPTLEVVDPNYCYFPNGYSSAYYYGGYEPNEWDDYARYVAADGSEIPAQGVYTDMYHSGYGYGHYGPYTTPNSPVPTMGPDGQLYSPQHYQYSTPYYQPPTPPPFTSNPLPTSQVEVSTSTVADQLTVLPESGKINSNCVQNGGINGNDGSVPSQSSYINTLPTSNGSHGRGVLPPGPISGYQDTRVGFDGTQAPTSWSDGPIMPDGQLRQSTGNTGSSTLTNASYSSMRNQNSRPPQLMSLHQPRPSSGFMNRMYPNSNPYGHYADTFRTSSGYATNGYDSRTNGRVWVNIDGKYRPRGRINGLFGYGNESTDGMNELNRGPRAGRYRSQKWIAPSIQQPDKGQSSLSNANKELSSEDKTLYNQEDFPTSYSNARFFVIKSYSEDDLHKSIKYSVWASTPSGNKKLDAAYKEAQDKSCLCPIFLFFSVNTSGQFVGVAEMVGPVDFEKNLNYWQQDKWNGCFPVKWHIVKDVPNSTLKHIILENNDNKPVTNSRDTQEVRLEQGLEMLKLFKEYTSKTCILDDFGFYEIREKVIQEKRTKQQFQKQVWGGKVPSTGSALENDKDESRTKLQKSKDSSCIVNEEVGHGGAGAKLEDKDCISKPNKNILTGPEPSETLDRIPNA